MPLITWEEFIQHDCEHKNLWITIMGKVYDVYNFSTCSDRCSR